MSADDCATILAHYHHVRPLAGVQRSLTRLSGYEKALVSNGNASMISVMVKNAMLADAFNCLVDSDEAGTFKPHAWMYALGLGRQDPVKVREALMGYQQCRRKRI